MGHDACLSPLLISGRAMARPVSLFKTIGRLSDYQFENRTLDPKRLFVIQLAQKSYSRQNCPFVWGKFGKFWQFLNCGIWIPLYRTSHTSHRALWVVLHGLDVWGLWWFKWSLAWPIRPSWQGVPPFHTNAKALFKRSASIGVNPFHKRWVMLEISSFDDESVNSGAVKLTCVSGLLGRNSCKQIKRSPSFSQKTILLINDIQSLIFT